MHELPEVQTIITDLNQKIKGDTIVAFWSDWKKSIKMPFDKFEKEMNRFFKALIKTQIVKGFP